MTSTQETFIAQIAPIIQKYAPKYNIKVVSPIIAQACLESAYGTSTLGKVHNYFGLKYRAGRCPSSNGTVNKQGSEQNADGSYVSSDMVWFKFPSMEAGVQGYFDFTNISSYSNLKGITSPEKYLQSLKEDHYATSLDYVKNNMAVIQKWNLTKYDLTSTSQSTINSSTNKGVTNMGNSSLVTYTQLSPNHSGRRTHAVDRITPHCVVGQLTAAGIASCFPAGRDASCNYGIGKDGSVALIVDEANRSWCSSSNANDQRAITIECASDTTSPYAMTSAVYSKLIDLCTDICKRYGKKKLIWFGDKTKSLNYNPKSDEMVITVHRWFANKACPGDWLYSRLGDVATQVTKRLGGSTTSGTTTNTSKPSTSSSTSTSTSGAVYQVTTDVLNIRAGAGTTYKITGTITDKGRYTVVQEVNGWGKLKSGAGWISLAYCTKVSGSAPSYNNTSASNRTSGTMKYKVTADVLNIRAGAGTGYKVTGQIKDKGIYTITEVKSGWGKLKSGAGWICLSYATKVS